MASGSQPQVKRGDKVRHTDGTEGLTISDATSGTIQVKTEKGVIVSCSVHGLTVIDGGQ
jgi:hypothetical protein